jgi:nitrous oxidase accessory protein NosD
MRARTIAISALIIGGLLVLGAVITLHPATVSTTPYRYLVTNVGGTCTAKDANGAVLTSGTDAAAVISAALNALTPGRTARETVLMDGDFPLTSAITMPSHATLEVAEGGSLTGADNSSTFLLYAVNGEDVEVIGGEWDGNRDNRGLEGNTMMAFVSCSNLSISGVDAHDAPYDAITFDSCNRVTVSGAEVGRVGHTALVMGNCSNCTLENSHIYDCGGGGCYFLGEEGAPACTMMNNALRNNTVERTLLTGLSLASLRGPQHRGGDSIAEHNTLIDCGLDGSHPGIACGWYPNTASGCVIRYNNISESGDFWPPNGNGTDVGIGAATDDSEIYGNTITKTYDGGMMILGSRNKVHDNVIIKAGPNLSYGGIVLGSAVVQNEVYDNEFFGPTYCGVTVENDASANIVRNNHFEGMLNGIAIVTSTTSAGNLIENNTYVGAGDIDDNGTGTVIRNNVPA